MTRSSAPPSLALERMTGSASAIRSLRGRNCRFPLRGFLAALLVLLVIAVPGWAQFGGEASRNFELSLSTLETGPTGAEALATLTLRVSQQHLVYHHSMAFKADPGKLDVVWPAPIEKEDPFEKKPVKVYPSGDHLFLLRFVPEAANGVATLTVEYQGCSSSTCFMPNRSRFPLAVSGAAKDASSGAASAAMPMGRPQDARPEATPANPATALPTTLPADQSQGKPTAPADAGLATADSIKGTAEPASGSVARVSTPSGQTDFGRLISERGVLWALLIAFVGGLLVSLTPCVYPMIPITLSIIGGRKENTSLLHGFGLSVAYVAGLSLTYALLGLFVASFGAQVRGILQGATFQLIMAGIFALLALSMFDVFMIEAPSFLRQRLAGAQGSGPAGVFFLGMLSGLMASPCVAAPLAGILAFIAASGSLVLGFLMLLSFAWGMGLLLIVIGTFSGAVQSLPRAGEWMNRVKEFYGFLLAGAALYFARPVIGAPWGDLGVALLLASFAAFLGLFSPPTPDDRLAPRVLRAWGVVTLAVACLFAASAVVNWGGIQLPTTGSIPQVVSAKAGGAGLMWHDRLEDALKDAKAQGRPVFVDFRADWCTICREMEEHVFPDPTVLPWLNRFALLKVDCTTNEGEPAELMKRFGVIGLPTLLVLDANGSERPQFRQVGGTDAKGLVEILRQVFR